MYLLPDDKQDGTSSFSCLIACWEQAVRDWFL